MDIFDGFRKHEADEEQASAETLAHLRPMLVGARWKLRWQHTGGGCSAWELYAADGRRVSDLQRYRMTGDGVAAPVAFWIGARLAAALHN